jgi:hypothetical protein
MYAIITATADELRVNAYTADGSPGCGGQGGAFDSFTINRLATPAPAPRNQPALMGMNGFADDAQTQRSFSWQLAPTDGLYTMSSANGSVDIVPALPDGTQPPPAAFDDPAAYHAAATGAAITDTELFPKQIQFKAAITGLSPGTKYFYRLHNSGKRSNGVERQYLSNTWSFTTEQANDESFTFITFADSQSGSTAAAYDIWGSTLSASLARFAQENNGARPPFVMQTGDTVEYVNAYGPAHYTAWYNATNDNLRDIPFYSAIGNHESNDMGNTGCTASNNKDATIAQLFAHTGNDGGYVLSYSFVYGNALFLAINTNHCQDADLTKIENWVNATIAAKGQGKFVIAYLHKSAYGGSHSFDWDVYNQLRGYYTDSSVRTDSLALEPALEKAGVHLVLAGHDHNYIRSFPSRNGVPQNAGKTGVKALSADPVTISASADGLVSLIMGFSGAKSYPLADLSTRPWIAYQWGQTLTTAPYTQYSLVTVSKDSIKVKSCSAGGTNGSTVVPSVCFDSFTITR